MFFLYFLAFSKCLIVNKWKNLGVLEYSKALIYMGPWSTWPQEALILKMRCFEFCQKLHWFCCFPPSYTDFINFWDKTSKILLSSTVMQGFSHNLKIHCFWATNFDSWILDFLSCDNKNVFRDFHTFKSFKIAIIFENSTYISMERFKFRNLTRSFHYNQIFFWKILPLKPPVNFHGNRQLLQIFEFP